MRGLEEFGDGDALAAAEELGGWVVGFVEGGDAWQGLLAGPLLTSMETRARRAGGGNGRGSRDCRQSSGPAADGKEEVLGKCRKQKVES